MAKKRPGRPLTPEDQDAWRRVTRNVRPSRKQVQPPAPAAPDPRTEKQTGNLPREAPKTPAAAPRNLSQSKNALSAAQLDGKLDKRISRGRIEPERTLDLHGLTAKRAEAILKLFISQSRSEGVRLILVITGKGRIRQDLDDFMPERKGVLRDHLPIWVSALGDAVVKTVPAHPRHGGEGAFYLYLRRRRGGP